MKRTILISALLFASVLVKAQILVYPDNRLFFTDMLVNINKEGALVEGNRTSSEGAMCTVRENKVYRGWSYAEQEVLFTVNDNKIYSGNEDFSIPLYTIKDGKFYRGNSTKEEDLLYTWLRIGVFKGTSTSPFDRVCFIQGRATQAEYFAVLLALGLLE
ncbi:MAG: hypothetical protein MK081_11565 [Flavobacteriales bacterium]|nr:hypothetical protein [Flavobacteriales bacterium]